MTEPERTRYRWETRHFDRDGVALDFAVVLAAMALFVAVVAIWLSLH